MTVGYFTGVVIFSSLKINSYGILGLSAPYFKSILIEIKLLWEVPKKRKHTVEFFITRIW